MKHPPSLASLGGPPVTAMWPCLVIAELLRMAPELLWGPGAPGRGTLRGDTFSIGIILQEVLTGGPPYGSPGLPAEGTLSSSSFLSLSLAESPRSWVAL